MDKKKLILYILGSTIFALATITLAYFTPKVITGQVFSASGHANSTDIENYITLTTQEDNITLNETYPMSESASLEQIKPYYFRISNNSNTNSVNYRVILEVNKENSISDEFISTNLAGLLVNNTITTPTTQDYDKAYILYEGNLVAREAQMFDLRVRVNENALADDVLGKTWKGKIVIKSAIEGESSKLKIISGDINTPGSEIKIGSEHFYIISNNNGTIRALAKYGLYIGKKVIWDWESEETTGVLTSVRIEIDPNEFNYGRQDKRVIGVNRYAKGGVIDTGKIVSYYAFIQFSDEAHGANQGTCENAQGRQVTCYSRYAGSILEEKINDYASLLSSETGINLMGDAISIDELISLGCTSTNCPNNLELTSGKGFFLKDSKDNQRVYSLLSTGNITASLTTGFNTCYPVIEFNLNDL